MKSQGEIRYEEGKLILALARFDMARLLGSDEWVKDANLDTMASNIRGDMDKVEIKRREARDHEAAKRLIEARRIILQLVEEFGEADLIADLLLPREIVTQPRGATVTLDGKELPAKTPCVVRLSPFRVTQIVLSRKGYQDHEFSQGPFGAETPPEDYDYVYPLKKEPTYRIELEGRVDARPVIWDGRVAAISREGHWAIADAKTGEILRSRTKKLPLRGHVPKSEGFTAGLVAAGDRVFAVSLDRKLYTFDLNDGKARMSALPHLKQPTYVAPVMVGNVLYIVDEGGTVIAIDRDTRREVWKQPAQTAHGVVEGLDMIVMGSELVVTARDGSVTILNLKDGRKVIDYKVRGPLSCAPSVVGKDRLVFANEAGQLQCVVAGSGTEQWPYELNAPVSRTLPSRSRAVFASPRPLELVAIDHTTGDVYFRYRATRANARAQVAPDNRVFFVHGRGLTAYARTPESYAPAWTFEADGAILAGPVESGGGVFIADEKGVVYRLDANDE